MLIKSHPSRVRGLKRKGEIFGLDWEESHPSRVRGLKLIFCVNTLVGIGSHPSRVRGLKRLSCLLTRQAVVSHPSRVRGLKPRYNLQHHIPFVVAPFTGAWIETAVCYVRRLIS